MPIDGHLPHLPSIGLIVCTSCRVGKHEDCGPIWDPARRRVLYCECAGPVTPNSPTCTPERP